MQYPVRIWIVAGLTLLAVVAATGLQPFGSGLARSDPLTTIDPAALIHAKMLGAKAGRAEWAATRTATKDLLALSEQHGRIAGQVGQQKAMWEGAFRDGYVAGWMAERNASRAKRDSK